MATIKLRRGAAAAWVSNNPVLGEGEVGVELEDTTKFKIGNGVTGWNDLAYAGGGSTGGGAPGADGATGPTGALGDNGAPGADGVTGPTGSGFVWKNQWDGTMFSYFIGDVVQHDGSSYVASADIPMYILNTPPPAYPWQLMVAAGVSGTPGDNGTAGSTGNTGPGLTWKGGWTGPGTYYEINDVVEYQGTSYVCRVRNMSPISLSNYDVLAIRGATGNNGIGGATGATGLTGAAGIDWKGTFNPTAPSYFVGDAVGQSGTSYICIQTTSMPYDLTNTAYWNVLAAVGATGTNGNNGATGPTGAADMSSFTGVMQITAGSGISLNPAGGTGTVQISASGGSAGATAEALQFQGGQVILSNQNPPNQQGQVLTAVNMGGNFAASWQNPSSGAAQQLQMGNGTVTLNSQPVPQNSGEVLTSIIQQGGGSNGQIQGGGGAQTSAPQTDGDFWVMFLGDQPDQNNGNNSIQMNNSAGDGNAVAQMMQNQIQSRGGQGRNHQGQAYSNAQVMFDGGNQRYIINCGQQGGGNLTISLSNGANDPWKLTPPNGANYQQGSDGSMQVMAGWTAASGGGGNFLPLTGGTMSGNIAVGTLPGGIVGMLGSASAQGGEGFAAAVIGSNQDEQFWFVDPRGLTYGTMHQFDNQGQFMRSYEIAGITGNVELRHAIVTGATGTDPIMWIGTENSNFGYMVTGFTGATAGTPPVALAIDLGRHCRSVFYPGQGGPGVIFVSHDDQNGVTVGLNGAVGGNMPTGITGGLRYITNIDQVGFIGVAGATGYVLDQQTGSVAASFGLPHTSEYVVGDGTNIWFLSSDGSGQIMAIDNQGQNMSTVQLEHVTDGAINIPGAGLWVAGPSSPAGNVFYSNVNTSRQLLGKADMGVTGSVSPENVAISVNFGAGFMTANTASPVFAYIVEPSVAAGAVALDLSVDGSITINKNADSARITMKVCSDSWSNSPQMVSYRAKGTVGSPAGVESGNFLSVGMVHGHDGVTFTDGAGAAYTAFSAAETWGATGHGTQYAIATTKVGETAPAARLTVKGNGMLNVSTVVDYVGNAAAVGAGLTGGDLYRNGDVLMIVH
jgi:hypothetical protein